MCKVPRWKRQTSVRHRNSFINSLRRTLIIFCKENSAAQTRFSEAQAELDRREWERRNAEIAHFETGRHITSLKN